MFAAGVAAIEAQFDIPRDFPTEVVAAAEAVTDGPLMPALDRTDLPFVTIDPAGARDLDQALHLERRGGGYRVRYAIADVAAFVRPGGPVDLEAHQRGQTLYAPDHRIPLHPPVLSEGAASLLPGQARPALLWTIDLDADGVTRDRRVQRAVVRSREQLDYAGLQAEATSGGGEGLFALLQEIGELLIEREADRGGVSLDLPEQEVVVGGGSWSLRYRELLPVERWNAQISLLTGRACADLMLTGGIGVLRTLPPPSDAVVGRMRRTATALHLRWSDGQSYQEFVKSLDPNTPAGAAMLHACTAMLRGASYVDFAGAIPDSAEHAAVAAHYAHCTAPLRRLVDRYAGEIALSVCAGVDVPEWVLSRLSHLPGEMAESDQRAHEYDGAVLSLVEAGLMAPRVGETFAGVVTEVDQHDRQKGSVMLAEPAVEASVSSNGGRLPLGEQVSVRLVEADPSRRLVRFELA